MISAKEAVESTPKGAGGGMLVGAMLVGHVELCASGTEPSRMDSLAPGLLGLIADGEDCSIACSLLGLKDIWASKRGIHSNISSSSNTALYWKG